MEGALFYPDEEPLNYNTGIPLPDDAQQTILGPTVLPDPILALHHPGGLAPYQEPALLNTTFEHGQDIAFHNEVYPDHNHVFQHPVHAPLSHHPYQYKPGEWQDRQEEEEEREEEAPPYSLEEALQDLNLQLPRLPVTAPISVLPIKGAGRCRLPNLGNSCYMNAVLQCFYHTPNFPAYLAHICQESKVGQKRRNSVAYALASLTAKMDDVQLMKKGVMAYFKGVCGLRDDTFAGMEQQEAYDYLSSVLLWLHQDLAGAAADEVDCACTKNDMNQRPASTAAANDATTSNNINSKHHSFSQGNLHNLHNHHQQQQQQGNYQYQPPVNSNHQPNFTIYTGNNHDNQHSNHNHNHYNHTKPPQHQPVNQDTSSSPNSSVPDIRREGEVCEMCGVTYQRRSFISDMFEGIHQSDIICARLGIILHTTYQRFTSLSLPLSATTEITLQEVLQHHYGVDMLMWDCDYCGKAHLCHQQVRVLCAPRILIIHLSRHGERYSSKKQSVVFPVDHLTLRNHLVPVMKTRAHGHSYCLYGVCYHHGTMARGHYTACCRANKRQTQEGSWFLFDDEEVSRTAHVNSKEAHILCYTS